MKQPFFWLAILYGLGIFCARQVSADWRIVGFAVWLLLLAALISGRIRRFAFYPALFLTGLLNGALHFEPHSPMDLRRLAGWKSQVVAVRGTAVSANRSVSGPKSDSKAEGAIRVVLQARSVQIQGRWRPASGKVLAVVPVSGESPSIYPLDAIVARGFLSRPRSNRAAGVFDYRKHLESQGIYYELRAAAWRDLEVLDRPWRGWLSLPSRFQEWGKDALARGLPEEDEPLALLQAMALGWRADFTDDLREPFIRSGAMHLFAISGLHIALIAGILLSLFRVARLPREASGLSVIPLLWFYAAATGWQASAVRASVMMSLVLAGWALRRPVDLLNSLYGAAFLILTWNPGQLFMPGFQLSFCVVLSIGLALSCKDRLLQNAAPGDPFLPVDLQSRWRRWLRAAGRYASSSSLISLAAWLGSLPWIAFYFHMIVPVGLLVNLLVLPLSGLALTSALSALICDAWFPWLAEVFSHSGWFWMRCLLALSEYASHLPGAWLNVSGWTPYSVAGYYAMLVCAFASVKIDSKRRTCLLGVILILALALTLAGYKRSRVCSVSVLPLQGGDAIYMDLPGRREDLLVDTGDARNAKYWVAPFLQSRGVRRLPSVLLTHGDVRHVGGLSLIAERFPIERVLAGPVAFRSKYYRDGVRLLDQLETPRVSFQRGVAVGRLDFLHPPKGASNGKADDWTAVFRANLHPWKILFLSDLSWNGQQMLFESADDLRADVVVTAIPSGEEPLAPALIQRIQPRAVIVSSAPYPASEHASIELRERLARLKIPCFYTDAEGEITIRIDGPGLRILTHRRGLACLLNKGDGEGRP